MQVIVSNGREDIKLKRVDLKEWGASVDVTDKIFLAILFMLSQRSQQLVGAYNDIHRDKDGYIPYKSSYYFPPSFFDDVEGN